MKELTKNRIKTLGIDPKDFEPTKVTAEDRIEAIEEAVMELAEMLMGGELDG